MGVSRLVLIFALALALLLSAVVGIIRAQPRDDSELRAFIISPDPCPMPCFIGMRPGMTTGDEALAILNSHPWIGRVDSEVALNRRLSMPIIAGQLRWAWSEQAPDFIDRSQNGYLWVFDNIVQYLGFNTHIPLGETRLLFGRPERIFVFTDAEAGTARITYGVGYARNYVQFTTAQVCPAVFSWYSPVSLRVAHIFDVAIYNTTSYPQVQASRC